MDLVSLLTSTTSKENPNAWNISKATYDPANSNWDITTAQEDGIAESFSGNIADLFFKPDGTKLYLVDATAVEVEEYDLSTPWDVETAVRLQGFSVSTEEAVPQGLFFKPDGTKMYIVGSGGDEVNEYDLSSAWDISTASHVQNFSVATEDTTPYALFFKPDGTKMYVLGASGDDVNEYSLSSAWDISTASYVQNFSVSTQEAVPQGLSFKPDGTKMYVIGSSGDDINQYDLSSAWDISTASFIASKAISTANPTGLYIHPDGLYVFVSQSSASNNIVRRGAFGGLGVSAEESVPSGLFFKPDGTKLYICGQSGDEVNEYDLATAWDIQTASYVQNFSVSTEETTPADLFFKPDGTKMYIVGSSGDEVNEYDLSVAWDISSASYVQNFSVASQDSVPTGLFFKPDGTKMYVTGNTGDDVNEYSLSSAWDISSASYVQNFSVAGQDTSPQSVFFRSDGTKMYVDGVEYDLSSAWDISTASHVHTNSALLIVAGIFWKDDGFQIWAIRGTSIFSYKV